MFQTCILIDSEIPAVDLLLRGACPYDVAKMLGHTIEAVEKHYMPFVGELRERVRRIL